MLKYCNQIKYGENGRLKDQRSKQMEHPKSIVQMNERERAHLPIIDAGIVIVFEYGSSSTGITVTSSLSADNDVFSAS